MPTLVPAVQEGLGEHVGAAAGGGVRGSLAYDGPLWDLHGLQVVLL